jgi:DinB family protein
MQTDDLLPRVRAVLVTTPDRWLSLAESLPVDLFTRPPAPGQWPAAECLRHLLDTERFVFPTRVRAFLAGQDFPSFDPGAQPPADLSRSAEMARDFAALREQSLALVAQLTPADLERTARHSELGLVTLGELLHEWAAHDLNHTVQAERALMQPFIAGCGPWRTAGYFADHDVEAHG